MYVLFLFCRGTSKDDPQLYINIVRTTQRRLIPHDVFVSSLCIDLFYRTKNNNHVRVGSALFFATNATWEYKKRQPAITPSHDLYHRPDAEDVHQQSFVDLNCRHVIKSSCGCLCHEIHLGNRTLRKNRRRLWGKGRQRHFENFARAT